MTGDFPYADTLAGEGEGFRLCRFARPVLFLPGFAAQPGHDGFVIDAGGEGGRADRGVHRHAAGPVAGDQGGDGFELAPARGRSALTREGRSLFPGRGPQVL